MGADGRRELNGESALWAGEAPIVRARSWSAAIQRSVPFALPGTLGRAGDVFVVLASISFDSLIASFVLPNGKGGIARRARFGCGTVLVRLQRFPLACPTDANACSSRSGDGYGVVWLKTAQDSCCCERRPSESEKRFPSPRRRRIVKSLTGLAMSAFVSHRASFSSVEKSGESRRRACNACADGSIRWAVGCRACPCEAVGPVVRTRRKESLESTARRVGRVVRGTESCVLCRVVRYGGATVP